MVYIDITKEDFDSLRKESTRVNTELQLKAGWKGRVLPFSFDAPGAYFMKVEPTTVVVIGEAGQVGRMDFSYEYCLPTGRMAVSGELFEGCSDAQQIARRLRETCLSEENVKNLRRNTCGCSEVVPLVARSGFADPNDVEVVAFFPEDRFDIRSALLRSGLSFTERPLSEYRRFCEENMAGLQETRSEVGFKNDFNRYSVLFDGKKFHRIERAQYLAGELGPKTKNVAVDTIKSVEMWGRFYKNTLTQMSFDTDKQLPSVIFGSACYPLVGDGSLFLVEDGKPQWGVYLNSEGRISVCDGDGWFDYPRRATKCDASLEQLLNSSESQDRVKGMCKVSNYLQSKCLSVENIEKAGKDIEVWCTGEKIVQEKSTGQKLS